MSQLFTVGRVISGPELKLSQRQTPYTQFTLVERVGTGARARDQFIRVWAWGPLAEQLIHAGVREASLIWAAGSLELEQFSREGKTDQQLRLTLKDWGFLPAMQKRDGEPWSKPYGPETNGEPREFASIINGDREPLPGEIRQNRNAV